MTIIVPLAAGTGMDTLARLYGEKLSQALGRPVVIENRPGAALALGAVAIATAAPDGHTVGVLTSGPMAIGPVLYKKINYDPQKDFVPISLYVKSPLVLVVDPALPIKSVPELIQYAKASAQPLTYSTPGAGAFQHLSTEFMAQRFGLKFTHVPYKSTPQSVHGHRRRPRQFRLCRGRRLAAADQGGKLRALAVSSLTRLPTVPEVPPFAEAANAPDFEAVSWHVLFAPAATPRPIVERLHKEMTQDHVGCRDAEARRQYRAAAAHAAVARGNAEIHRVGTREMGLAGAQARARRNAVATREASNEARIRSGLRRAVMRFALPLCH